MKLVAKDIKGLNPDTGELEFEFEEINDGTPAPTPEQQEAAQKNFSGGDPNVAQDRYKAVQGWATRVHQQNLGLQQRLAALEAQAQLPPKPVATPTQLPTATDPGAPDVEALFQNPQEFQSYVQDTVRAHLGLVGKYVEEQLEPYRPVLSAYQTHNELQTVAARHPDFVHWHKEMLAVSSALPQDQEMTLEQLYYEARQQNPDKAMSIDMGTFNPQAASTDTQAQPVPAAGQPQLQAAQPGTSQPVPGTAAPAPGTTQSAAQQPYNPALPGQKTNFPSAGTATAEELQHLAARNTTETGVGDGNTPTATTVGIDAAMEAAWTELSAKS
jgi:hypothetical protein